jgi:hypothetical protein
VVLPVHTAQDFQSLSVLLTIPALIGLPLFSMLFLVRLDRAGVFCTVLASPGAFLFPVP